MRKVLIMQRLVNVGIYEEAAFGISYSQIPCLEMLKTSVLSLGNKHNGRYYRFESSRRIGVSAYDCLVFQEGVFIEEDNFVEKLFFRRLRCLAILKIGLLSNYDQGVAWSCPWEEVFSFTVDVVSCIAEDIAGEGLDRGTFVLTLGSC
ncbi:hypothetical protein F2Q69_00043554 [Brassica cretica]|uniref:Uncharacterized protein n=1 Tax=Brassica cretica TaxID=69181 RepID=A0A8S9NHG3_BRACR|nr:hypothetical protein F2Q69_00043554 [Brassica cretica]